MNEAALLSSLILLATVWYSAVGHAGGSGYLAAMGLMGVAPEVMKPAALALNVLVASTGTVRFCRAGCCSWPVFFPFAVGSVPLAVGGGLVGLELGSRRLGSLTLRRLLAVVLTVAGIKLLIV
jgi:uncharacterized membrane protein YfcA